MKRTKVVRAKKKSLETTKTKARKLPWRTNPNVWTDTFCDKKLLQNPGLMTSNELANALAEHQKWRTSQDKYDWKNDPFKENKENEPPFSPLVLSRLLYEAIARLAIIGDTHCGRYKTDVKF